MKRMVIRDQVSGCSLESVEVGFETLQLEIENSMGTKEKLSLRVFFPMSVNGGKNVVCDYLARLKAGYGTIEGASNGAYSKIARILEASISESGPDEKHERMFSLDTLTPQTKPWKKTTFDDIREGANLGGLANLELMLRLTAEVPSSSGSMANLVYAHPDIKTPLSEGQHRAFQERLIDEIIEVRSHLSEMARGEFKKAKRRVMADKTLSAQAHGLTLERLDEAAIEAMEKAFKIVMTAATVLDEEYSAHFLEVVNTAREIHDRFSDVMISEGKLGPDRRIIGSKRDVRWLMKRDLPIDKIDYLIDSVIMKLQEVNGLSDQETEDTDGSVSFDGTKESRGLAVQQCDAFRQMRSSRDPLEKWGAIIQILSTFVPHTESVRLYQRRCDHIEAMVIDSAYREIYRKIRRHLTRPERRLFLLLYCAVPVLGGQIAVQSVPIQSFYWGMDEETQDLILMVAVFKMNSFDADDRLDQELRRRFQSFLRFYPYWVMTVREDERERKHFARRRTAISIWDLTIEGGDPHESFLPDPIALHDNPMAAVVLAEPREFLEWARKYCLPQDIERMMLRFESGLLEKEIAEREGVTQQAVSLTILRGVASIKRGLRRDNLI